MRSRIVEKIEIAQGDITKFKVDAIVNAANKRLLGGGGVDGAIHRAAGPELLEYCKTIGGCSTGEAVISPGYRLFAKYVIHTVGPIYSGAEEDKLFLADCYENSLKLAVQHGAVSVAFPAISCGVYGYPVEDACEIAVNTTRDFLKIDKKLNKVIFVLYSSKYLKVYADFIDSVS